MTNILEYKVDDNCCLSEVSSLQFLNTAKPWSPYLYTGMFFGHLLFFGVTFLLFKLRDLLRGTDLTTTGPFIRKGKSVKGA